MNDRESLGLIIALFIIMAIFLYVLIRAEEMQARVMQGETIQINSASYLCDRVE